MRQVVESLTQSLRDLMFEDAQGVWSLRQLHTGLKSKNLCNGARTIRIGRAMKLLEVRELVTRIPGEGWKLR